MSLLWIISPDLVILVTRRLCGVVAVACKSTNHYKGPWKPWLYNNPAIMMNAFFICLSNQYRYTAFDMASKHLSTQDFNLAVYQIVRAIPSKRIITCSQIAKLIGFPDRARQVREAVSFIAHTNPPVAWYRVIATSGIVSIDGPNTQQRLLEAEGIDVNTGVLGESRVTVEKWGWLPEANETSVRTASAEDDQEWVV